MADSVILPNLYYFQWSTPTAPNPTLSAPLAPGDTTAYFTNPPLDHNGAIITGGFLMGVKNSDSYVMTMYVAPGAVAADGLSATVVQGIDLEGIDYTVGDADLIPSDGFNAGDAIFCNISGVIGSLLSGAIKGTLATNGLGFIIGDGTNTNATISHKDASSTKGWLRKNPTTGKVEFSDNGTDWVTITSVSTSNLVVASGTDTTPSTLDGKLTVTSGAGATVTKTITNPGMDEKVNISVAINTASLNTIANRDNSYTPAYLTSGVNVFATHNLWTGTTDGSFQITIDGTSRSITGLNFSAVTSMANVASIIQAGIRAVTSGLETCTWTGTTLVVASGLTTVSSAITVTSAGVGGTDISGAGGADYMDCDTGHGVVTATALNPTGDAGKIVGLDTDGYINNNLYKLPVPVIRTYTITNPVLGSTNSQFDITNPSGTTMRVTFNGTGTDPLISATTVPTGTILDIYAQNFNAGNKGRFTVTASGANYFEVTNAGVVPETNKTIGTGSITVNQKPLGNWIKPDGLGYVVVEVVGGGGGGGGTSTNDSAGGGGGGGGYSKRAIAAAALGATEAVTVGGGGVGYTSGAVGGTSSFGVLVQATGGNGGTEGTSGPALGGDGGIGSTGDINTTGDDGGTGAIDSTYFMTTGSGGGSALGGSAKGGIYFTTGGGNGSAGNIYGGGGAGGGNADNNDDRIGGIGAVGVVIVTEYF